MRNIIDLQLCSQLLFTPFLLHLLLQSKDPIDSRSRGPNIPSSRTNKGGTDRYAGRGSLNQFGSSGM